MSYSYMGGKRYAQWRNLYENYPQTTRIDSSKEPDAHENDSWSNKKFNIQYRRRIKWHTTQ